VKGEHYGKFRGVVIDNVDPMMIGRLMVMATDVTNILPTTWAMPCLPFAGIQNGMFAVPAIGSGVWIEYEQGDPDYPIWSGCFFGTAAEPPALAMATPPGLQAVVIQTIGQNTLMISDTPGPTGGILLKSQTGAIISISDTGSSSATGKALPLSWPARR
jgi:uncharacterized protein involved in type VI secretion and phage assembly